MSKSKTIQFQISDLYTENIEEVDSSEDDNEDTRKYKIDNSEYKIIIFGKDENQQKYSVLVEHFTPYYYVKVPDDFTKNKISIFQNWLLENMWSKHRNSLLRITLHKKMKFRGFTNKKKFNFIRLVFKNTNAMKHSINLFQNKTWDPITKKISKITPKKIYIQGITKKQYNFDLYEIMIDPLLRFIHHRELKPVGWIKLNKYEEIDEPFTTSDVNIKTNWKNIKFCPCEDNAKLKVLSYDIECNSSHGDFPLPKKDYLKLSREIYMLYENIQKRTFIDKHYILNRYIKDKVKLLEVIFEAAFNNGKDEYDINKVYIKDNYNKPNIKTIEIVIKKIVKHLVIYNPNLKTLDRNREKTKYIKNINNVLNSYFPPLKGDQTIQIGCSFIRYGEFKPYRNVILTLHSCDDITNTEVYTYDTENKLLMAFHHLIISEDPDIITGYNILGFDTPWLMKRADELNILDEFSKLSKLVNYTCFLKEKQEKSGVGQLIKVEFVDIPGRIQLDILKLVQKAYNLDSYKLDNVSAHFIRGNIIDLKHKKGKTYITTNNLRGLNIGNFIIFIEQDGYLENKYKDGQKYEIMDICGDILVINDTIDIHLDKQYIWCLGKDDVSPKDIFRLQDGNSRDRYIIAKYCMMDVILCIELLLKLELITNYIGMANVCLIPLNWSIHRGQGVKLLSLVTEILRKENYLLPYLYKSLFNRESYEGAIVLPPYPGIYLDDPVAVLDYASLYPSSMIMGNLSHETICEDEKWLGDEGIQNLKKIGYDYYDVEYDTYETIYTPAGSVKEKRKIGVKKVRYVQCPNGEKGLIPKTLQHLLNARKNARTKIKYKNVTLKDETIYTGLVNYVEDKVIIITEKKEKIEVDKLLVLSIEDKYNQFQKNVLDGLQLAFKITANSLYGQIGARVSDLYYKEIAASTTSIGRQQLDIAQTYCENPENFIKVLDTGETIKLKNKIVYGDTDSVFVRFECRYNNGEKMKGRDALEETIKLAVKAQDGIKKILMKPQDLEYEKTFWPFILFTKKRYVGNKYEFDLNKYKQTSMGIVTKRRDNAPIVKVIFGGIIDIIMRERNIRPSIDFLQKTIKSLINGNYNLDTLIISKTLSSFYKDPDRIAHKVLANRIAEREPGNKPKVNDRIPFIYIKINEKKCKGTILQGDKIETPQYIKTHDLKPNYEFYITNQIMKPVCQIYGLCLEDIPSYRPNTDYELIRQKYLNNGCDMMTATKKMLEKKQKEAGKLLFNNVLRTLENQRNGDNEITKWFTPMKV